MMDSLITLVALCVVMAIASFLAGSLPLSLSLSPSQLRLLSTVGMGVLVGTSLIIIIPEGIETIYSASAKSVGHTRRDIAASNNLPIAVYGLEPRAEEGEGVDAFLSPGPVIPTGANFPPKTPTEPGVVGILEENKTSSVGQSPSKPTTEDDHDHEHSPHAWTGVALISGFIMMYLIDKLPKYATSGKPKSRTHHIALNNLGRRFNMATSLDPDEESEGFLGDNAKIESNGASFATTTGLVIHAAADGIALGASSSTPSSGLSFIIFFAIMVHKAPAAFGLTSVLLKQGVSKRTARAHLILFSLAAPVGALLTWVLAGVLGAGHTGSANGTEWWTGLLLLFSGGTFLYVAMHAMQESDATDHEPQTNGHAGGPGEGREANQPEPKASLRDLLAACFGMILPLFLQFGHAH